MCASRAVVAVAAAAARAVAATVAVAADLLLFPCVPLLLLRRPAWCSSWITAPQQQAAPAAGAACSHRFVSPASSPAIPCPCMRLACALGVLCFAFSWNPSGTTLSTFICTPCSRPHFFSDVVFTLFFCSHAHTNTQDVTKVVEGLTPGTKYTFRSRGGYGTSAAVAALLSGAGSGSSGGAAEGLTWGEFSVESSYVTAGGWCSLVGGNMCEGMVFGFGGSLRRCVVCKQCAHLHPTPSSITNSRLLHVLCSFPCRQRLGSSSSSWLYGRQQSSKHSRRQQRACQRRRQQQQRCSGSSSSSGWHRQACEEEGCAQQSEGGTGGTSCS